eukprot:5440994-Pleurochrysis_carterae.AAC.3
MATKTSVALLLSWAIDFAPMLWMIELRGYPGIPPIVAPLHRDAVACNPPKRLMNRRGVVEVCFRKGLGDAVGSLARMVMRNRAVDVVCDVGRADAVMQPVKESSVRPVNGQKGAAHESVLLGAQVRHVHIRVLQPRINHEPSVHYKQWPTIERKDGCKPRGTRPQRQHGEGHSNACRRRPYL